MTRIDQASRVIHAAPDRLYRAFQSAEAIQAWLPPKGMKGQLLSFDFREGGSYRMRLSYGEGDHSRGKTDEDSDEVEVRFGRLVEGESIEQLVTFETDRPEFSGTMRITWLFRAVPRGTEVTVRCEDVPPGIRAEDHEVGLASTLENLAAFTE